MRRAASARYRASRTPAARAPMTPAFSQPRNPMATSRAPAATTSRSYPTSHERAAVGDPEQRPAQLADGGARAEGAPRRHAELDVHAGVDRLLEGGIRPDDALQHRPAVADRGAHPLAEEQRDVHRHRVDVEGMLVEEQDFRPGPGGLGRRGEARRPGADHDDAAPGARRPAASRPRICGSRTRVTAESIIPRTRVDKSGVATPDLAILGSAHREPRVSRKEDSMRSDRSTSTSPREAPARRGPDRPAGVPALRHAARHVGRGGVFARRPAGAGGRPDGDAAGRHPPDRHALPGPQEPPHVQLGRVLQHGARRPRLPGRDGRGQRDPPGALREVGGEPRPQDLDAPAPPQRQVAQRPSVHRRRRRLEPQAGPGPEDRLLGARAHEGVHPRRVRDRREGRQGRTRRSPPACGTPTRSRRWTTSRCA